MRGRSRDAYFTQGNRNSKRKVDRFGARNEEILTRDKDLVTRDKDLVSRDEDLVTPDDELLTPDEDLVSPDEDLVTPDDELLTRDDELLTPDDELLTRDEDRVIRDAHRVIGAPDESRHGATTPQQNFENPGGVVASWRLGVLSRRSIGRPELSLERFEVGADLGVGDPEGLDLAHGAHDRRVVAVAEGAPELGEAALQALLAQVHRHVAGEGHALVPVLARGDRRSAA